VSSGQTAEFISGLTSYTSWNLEGHGHGFLVLKKTAKIFAMITIFFHFTKSDLPSPEHTGCFKKITPPLKLLEYSHFG